MLGGRDSAYALNISLPYDTFLELGDGTSPGARYAFAGGTTITGGGDLWVSQFNTLVSNVAVDGFSSLTVDGTLEGNILNAPRFNPADGSRVFIGGQVRGNLDNAGVTVLPGAVAGTVTNTGELNLIGRVDGNVTNSGRLVITGFAVAEPDTFGTINGNLTQTAGGTFVFRFAPGDPAFQAGPLQVTGQALLAGTLELGVYTDAFGPYPLPGIAAQHLIHANGGVSGQFAQWTSPGLFLEGSVRYASNDVWFDLTRISVQAVMAANAGAPQIISTAATLDRVFDAADVTVGAAPGPLDPALRQLLVSAGAVLHIDDLVQATRTLDSVSGRALAAAHGGLLDTFDRLGPSWSQLRQWRDATSPHHAWVATASSSSAGNGRDGWPTGRTETAPMSGFTQRLGPHLLVGAAAGRGDAWVGRGGDGRTRTVESLALLHGHAWRGPWHAHAELRGSRGMVDTWRDIDVGDRRTHRALADFGSTRLRARLEGGVDHSLGGGEFTPYAALQYDWVHSGAFTERGDTGLELMVQPATRRRTSVELGVRLERYWQGPSAWLRLEATGARRQALRTDGGLAAVFTGMPNVGFQVDDDAASRPQSWLDLQLEAGRGAWWSTGLRYRWSTDDFPTDSGWALEFQRKL